MTSKISNVGVVDGSTIWRAWVGQAALEPGHLQRCSTDIGQCSFDG
jgi:hypothetical protein